MKTLKMTLLLAMVANMFLFTSCSSTKDRSLANYGEEEVYSKRFERHGFHKHDPSLR